MKISYHAWKEYQECPKKYFLKYRKKEPGTVPQNDYFTLYGVLTERFFTLFSNIWRYNTPYIPPDAIRSKLEVLYKEVLETTTVDWTAPFVKYSEQEIFEQSLNDVCAIMDSQNQNYFLNSSSEILIGVDIKDGARITGRLDFIHKIPLSPTDVVIFDGKGTDKIGKNVSDDQVLYYALLHYFHYKVLPIELGFFYYRFNTFVPVQINMDILNEFRARVSLVVKKIITDSEFKPSPSAKSCKYCEYRLTCTEGLESSAKRKKGSRLSEADLDCIAMI